MTKLVYAAVAATLLAPLPALAGDLGPGDYYGTGPYEDYEDYAPVVRKEIVVERPVVVHKRIVVERPLVVERPVVVERPLVVERPVVVEHYGYGPRYGEWYHRRHFRDHYRKDFSYGYRRHFDDEDGDRHHRGYGRY